jgi:hypothetical protein
MNKWRWLVGATSLALLFWGASAFIEHGRSASATGDRYDGWVFSALGLLGLFVLVVPRSGYLVAVIQFVATAYALWLGWVAFVLALTWTALPMLSRVIPALILAMASVMFVLCGINAVGAWQIASRTRRCA